LQERAQADKWSEGAKSNKNKEDKEEKRKAELARKAENARLLAEEEASVQKKKSGPKPGARKATTKAENKPAGPGALAADGGLTASTSTGSASKNDGEPNLQEIESFSATGLDNALDLLDVVNAKTDKASVGNQAAGIERHPEVRGF
jgi:hypothetical protein